MADMLQLVAKIGKAQPGAKERRRFLVWDYFPAWAKVYSFLSYLLLRLTVLYTRETNGDANTDLCVASSKIFVFLTKPFSEGFAACVVFADAALSFRPLLLTIVTASPPVVRMRLCPSVPEITHGYSRLCRLL
jgi:hypothetical protein